MKKYLVWSAVALAVILGAVYLFSFAGSQEEFCGGITGETCGFGHVCKYKGVYPDAEGRCIGFLPALFSGGEDETTAGSDTVTCEDSDGLDYYTKGQTRFCDFITFEEPGATAPIGCALHEDFCPTEFDDPTGKELNEYYCRGSELQSKKYVCPQGCSNGACSGSGQAEQIEGKPCGGIAANLPKFQCPAGYECQLEGNYPDASGTCVKN
jgi:hypothetical protein